MKLAQSVVLSTFAAACDEEHDPGCVATAPPIESKLSCPWKVTSDDITVNNPIIRQANPGLDCDYINNAKLHLDTCEKCGNTHVPCDNTFTACGGCCQSENSIVLREHNCDEVKDYFRWRNECPLKLMTADVEEEPDNSAVLRPIIKNHTAAKVLKEGILETGCKVEVEQFNCTKIPAIVEFDCNQCNIGSADLMAKCCNECVRFSTSETLANVTMIEPFVVCAGCQTKTINIPWKGAVTQQPWVHAGKYDEYSREAQEDRMDEWVDKKICSKLDKDSCENPPRKLGRLLGEAATTTTTTREVLEAQCRRLEELESSSTSGALTTVPASPVASTIAGALTIAGEGKVVKGNNTTSGSDTSHSVAMSVSTAMAVMVSSVVLV